MNIEPAVTLLSEFRSISALGLGIIWLGSNELQHQGVCFPFNQGPELGQCIGQITSYAKKVNTILEKRLNKFQVLISLLRTTINTINAFVTIHEI